MFNLEEYREYLRKYGSKSLEQARILEIGFGTRALRLIALNAIGADATGVDLDKPIVNGTPREFLEIWRKNGPERALKSIVRYWLNDRRERRSLYRKVAKSSAPPGMPTEKMIISSAADEALWDSFDGKFDLILSEDVFEHIPRDELEIVVARMSRALSPGGIALIRPMIYSGISGGHQLEWYPYTIDRDIARDT
ncbi:MAG: SAM-dependent methyltransferase [Alphaproteobacteria bacterium]